MSLESLGLRVWMINLGLEYLSGFDWFFLFFKLMFFQFHHSTFI